ncbi:MAG: chromosome segregation protein SMC [Nitrospiraceae bacterium]|nr:chromosome segregation protein SMC [Nitrospiraceae bacterium]
MRIEKFELIGFKSFADKTVFNLHPGITCVVGPNGCGKSNIVDAFRWVLGEQSAKSLRGEKMDEVIFNGSAQKKQKGMAEVTMVISGMNTPKTPQVRFSDQTPEQAQAESAAEGTQAEDPAQNPSPDGGEPKNVEMPLNAPVATQSDTLSVTRRLYRSGESEYMINKTPCRLKDIKDIFLDTGLDFRSYSILEQGRIGEILNSKPADRRFIIEEVAGVMKYKVRKAEALSKLESSRVNLTRINDIVTEVKKQINILDRLAKKAERYKKLSAEMHAIELKIERNEYQGIKDANQAVTGEYGSLKEKEAVLAAEITGTENKTQSRRIELLDREKALELIQKDFQQMEREIAEIERTIAVSRNDISNLGDYRTRLTTQVEENDKRSVEIGQRIEELQISGREIGQEMETHAEMLHQKTSAFRTIEEALADQEERIEEKRREIFKVSEEISRLRNELSRQHAAYENHERREANAHLESEDSRRILAGIESSISSVEAIIVGNNNENLILKEKQGILTEELAVGRNRLEELMKTLAGAREEIASNQSRLESLREIIFDEPTRELIEARSDIRLLGSVSDVIEVDPRYEKAVEAALYEKADMLILESEESVENAVLSIRGAGTGRTAFMPVAPNPLHSAAAQPEGVVARALDVVKVKDGFQAVASNLLSPILIVPDIHAAFAAARSAGGNFTIVTVDGEVIEPTGAVVVGEGKGVFKRKREIRELEELLETKKASLASLNEEIQTVQDTIAEKEETIREVQQAIHNLEKEISLSKLTVENYAEEKERTNRKLSYLTLEIEEAVKEKTALSEVITGTEQKIGADEARKAEIEAESARIQEEIAVRKAEIEEHRTEVTELRLLAASNREKLESVRKEIETSQKTVAELADKRSELLTEKESVNGRITQREAEILERDGHLRRLVADADVLRLDLSRKKEAIEQENAELFSIEQGLRGLRHELSAIVQRLSELDVLRTEHKMRLENLATNVRNNFGVEIEDLPVEEVTEEEQTRLSELRAKLQEMGQVNLGTLEEYEELTTRYEFLSRQQEDLSKSIAELEEAISKINSTTRKKLRDAFEILNAKFGEIFVRLFGGGKAALVLTDESNILETGIDIVAQPPGKKLQNIHLLSGGEKALTALSISFASFLIKPTPLCILDEADAPLDESNTERYSRMLQEMSSFTQFIVVTHNRTTMSVGQHIYGITMQEAGVSKIISMQLEDIAA